MQVYENRSDNLSNNLRLNEISILIFFQFHCKINRNRLEIVLEATYGLQPYKYYEILNLKFWGRSKVIKRSRFHSNSQGVHEIKDFPVSVDFQAYKHAVVTPVQYYISMPSIRNAILHIFTTFVCPNTRLSSSIYRCQFWLLWTPGHLKVHTFAMINFYLSLCILWEAFHPL